MHRGYVKLWRKSLDSTVWKNPNLWRFWSWCLMKATHRDSADLVGYQCVQLKPGEFVFGRKIAAAETGLSERTIRTCLSTLQKLGNLTIKTTNKFSILTIENWGDYQGNDQQTTSETTSKRPASDHIQEHKNAKNKKEEPPIPHGGNSDAGNDEKQEPDPPKPKPSPDPKPKKKPVAYTEAFEYFWSEYPKLGRKCKGAAFASWQKLDIETQRAAYKAIKAQVQADNFRFSDGEQRVPHASTWLNQRRWDDEVIPLTGRTPDEESTPTLTDEEVQEMLQREAERKKEAA